MIIEVLNFSLPNLNLFPVKIIPELIMILMINSIKEKSCEV